MTDVIGEYPFTLLATLLNSNQKIIPCAEHSKLKKELHLEGIQEHLAKALSKKELKELEKEQKKKIVQIEYEFKQEKNKILKEHFKDAITKQCYTVRNRRWFLRFLGE